MDENIFASESNFAMGVLDIDTNVAITVIKQDDRYNRKLKYHYIFNQQQWVRLMDFFDKMNPCKVETYPEKKDME